jgi:hypothetical protein
VGFDPHHLDARDDARFRALERNVRGFEGSRRGVASSAEG